MSEGELIALAAIVFQESVLMAGENQQRERNGYSTAYVLSGGLSPNADRLEEELKRRRVEREKKGVPA